jgi:hypothetical protein
MLEIRVESVTITTPALFTGNDTLPIQKPAGGIEVVPSCCYITTHIAIR